MNYTVNESGISFLLLYQLNLNELSSIKSIVIFITCFEIFVVHSPIGNKFYTYMLYSSYFL